jgi:hypothetical protein
LALKYQLHSLVRTEPLEMRWGYSQLSIGNLIFVFT